MDSPTRVLLQESLNRLTESLRLHPDKLQDRLELARVLAQMDDWEALPNVLQDGVPHHFGLVWSLYYLGFARRARLALEALPDSPSVWCERGRMLLEQGLPQQALECFQRARHFGLQALTLSRLGRRLEAGSAWLQRGSDEIAYPEVQEFQMPRATARHYREAHQALLFHGDGKGCSQRSLLREFLHEQHHFGWPVKEIRSAHPEARSLVEFLAAHLPRCDSGRCLWVALRAEALPHLSAPGSLTFALSDHPEALWRGEVPDLTGVLGEPPEWESPGEKWSFPWIRCTDGLRAALQPQAGWKERECDWKEQRDRSLLEKLGEDGTEWSWVCDPGPTLVEAARIRLETGPPGNDKNLLGLASQSPQFEALLVWHRHPDLRSELLRGDLLKPEHGKDIDACLLCTGDDSLRESCLSWLVNNGWKFSPESLQNLRQDDRWEFDLWLERQSQEETGALVHYDWSNWQWPKILKRLQAGPCQEVALARLRQLQAEGDRGLRLAASACLGRWGCLPLEELLAWAEAGQGWALTELARIRPDLALPVAHSQLARKNPQAWGTLFGSSPALLTPPEQEALAIRWLEVQPEAALQQLLRLRSPVGLKACRRLVLKGGNPHLCAAYLDELGEGDEELLESLVCLNKPAWKGVLRAQPYCLRAARAMIGRGYPEYRQLFLEVLGGGEFEDALLELLEWGTPKALEILLEGANLSDLEVAEGRFWMTAAMSETLARARAMASKDG